MSQHDQSARVIYEQMIAAHQDKFGAPSTTMRHYLQGLSVEISRRMGLTRELAAESEDGQLMSVPVEQQWEDERRARGERRTAEGQRWPVRQWREVQMLRTGWLPTEKTWR